MAIFLRWKIKNFQDKERCEIISQALLIAHMRLYFKHDDNFPKRTGEFTVQADFPANFTIEKAYLCGAFKDDYYLKDKPKAGDMIVIVPSTQGKLGSVTVKLERADYDSLSEEIYNNKMNNRLKTIERIFNYYNLD